MVVRGLVENLLVLFFSVFTATPAENGSSKPRGPIRTAAVARVDLSCICDLHSTGSLTH